MDGVHSRLAKPKRPSIARLAATRAGKKTLSMWLIGLELGIAALLLLVVGLALRTPKQQDNPETETPPHE